MVGTCRHFCRNEVWMATHSVPTRLIPLLLSVLLIGACGSVPESMQVRAGVDPRHQDDDVRFRTTYYFRVFDVCRDRNGKALRVTPHGDSLYRFRMTGKAKGGLTSKVHFESGILHKTEIDPFGSSVVFDDKLGRHRVATCPFSGPPQRFVEVARGRCDPESVYERTWAKYLWRVAWESHPENRSVMGKRRSVRNDREDWKRMRGAVWAEVRRRAQGWDD